MGASGEKQVPRRSASLHFSECIRIDDIEQMELVVDSCLLSLQRERLKPEAYENLIPASLRIMLPLPICLNIFRIWAYWRRR